MAIGDTPVYIYTVDTDAEIVTESVEMNGVDISNIVCNNKEITMPPIVANCAITIEVENPGEDND